MPNRNAEGRQDGAAMRPTTSRERRKQRRAAARDEKTFAEIASVSRKRQDAWTETGQPFLTARLTERLDELYADYRDERGTA